MLTFIIFFETVALPPAIVSNAAARSASLSDGFKLPEILVYKA